MSNLALDKFFLELFSNLVLQFIFLEIKPRIYYIWADKNWNVSTVETNEMYIIQLTEPQKYYNLDYNAYIL